jgi:hypothetical protein
MSGITTRDLIYKNQSSVWWNLGSLRNLNMYLTVDDDQVPLQLPINNPVIANFKLVHINQ